MTEILLVGGQQRSDIDPDKTGEWRHYARGVIAAMDLETGKTRDAVSWVSPPEACPDGEASFIFKAGSLDVPAGRFYACSQTEVMVYEYPSFRRLHYISIPPFNDLHHVAPSTEGTLIVTVTGLDMVMEVDLTGRVVQEWSVDPDEAPWTRFSRDVDYRRVPSTKPHRFHPNYSFRMGGELWVSRADGWDAQCLTADGNIQVGSAAIHDGHVVGDKVFFTQVSGHFIEVNGAARCIHRVHEIPRTARGVPRGWCRGLEVLGDDLYLIGFSRLRPTKWKQSVQWLKKELGSTTAHQSLVRTHIVAYDARRGAVIWETELESAGLNAVFSIHATDPSAAREFFQQFR